MNKRIASFDVLRLLCCALVLAQHARELVPARYLVWWEVLQLNTLSTAAVATFFALSGYLITRILLKEHAAGQPIWHFLARRAARIFPPYYVLLVMLTLCGEPLHWTLWAYVDNLRAASIGHYTGGPWLGHAWSLCVEEQWYLIWPWVISAAGAVNSRRTLLWGAIPCAMAACWLNRADHVYAMRFTGTVLMPLACGAVMAFGRRTPSRQARWISIGLVLVGMSAWPFWHRGPYGAEPLVVWLSMSAVGVGAVLACLAWFEPAVGPLLGGHPIMTDLGVASYGVYLYHVPIFELIARQCRHGWPAVAIAVATTIGVVFLSYVIIERPLIRWASARFRGPAVAHQPAVSSGARSGESLALVEGAA